MRIICLVLILLHGGCYGGDVPAIPSAQDARAWDEVLKPKEKRFDPFLMSVSKPKTVVDNLTVTYITSNTHRYTLLETDIDTLVLLGSVQISATHSYIERGIKVTILNIGTLLETKTKLILIPR